MNNTSTRKILDASFTALAYSSLAAVAAALALFLFPIFFNGAGAFIFRATVEHEKFLYENLDADLSESEKKAISESDAARAPLYEMMREYESPPNAEKLRDRLAKSYKESVEAIGGASVEILGALDKKAPERAESIRNISKKLWEPYLSTVRESVQESAKNGTSIALSGILAENEAELAATARAELALLGKTKRLSFRQKSLVRRIVTELPSSEISAALETLESRNRAYASFRDGIAQLLGPRNKQEKEAAKLMRQKYGQTRMDTARKVLENSVLKITVKERDKSGAEFMRRVSVSEYFHGTPVEKMAEYVGKNADAMLRPHIAAYPGFLFDDPYDSSIFGGIWPMVLGTFYLTFGSMLMAAPLGVAAAVYFSEYARGGKLTHVLDTCVGTLAGVPSIVFGLFGLAFLINTVRISESKSVLAGSVTLALLVLPTIIRSCEEALKAVPNSYREAAFALGAGKWRSIRTVILPAALPSMLTGIIISMGRAAGETAPIIFTAATSTGAALAICDVFTQPTPALPWNIYNLCTEHEMAERVSHVQYGMVMTLILIVLALNGAAIWLRARLRKKMKF